MAWKQYAIIKVHNDCKTEKLLIKFGNKSGIWGWMFTPVDDDDNQRTELSLATIEAHAILPGASYAFGNTGYADRAEGAAAEFDIYAVGSEPNSIATKISYIQYASPWGTDNNFFTVKMTLSGWSVSVTSDFKPSSGPLGHITLNVSKTS